MEERAIQAVVLIGPTGSGKTELSLQIAKENFEIISSDSVQIYKYLDIGSCKPTKEQRAAVRHYLVDIIEPDYNFSAGDFCQEALAACKEISQKRKFPLFVGGCAFYVNAFFKGLSDIPAIKGEVRNKLKKELKERGPEVLYEELKRCDSAFANKIHPNDKQRIIRGLEVYRGTGKPITSFYNIKNGHESADTLYLGVDVPRPELKEMINNRVDELMKAGFLEEVIELRNKGYDSRLTSLQSIGYLELNEYIDGKISYEEAVERIKTATRRYAKRQMTWYRRNKKIHWFKRMDIKKINDLLSIWIDDKK